MNMAQWGIVFKKEMLDLFRDRKTWTVTLLLPFLLIPGLLFLMTTVMSHTQEAARNYIPIVIQNDTPVLVEVLRKHKAVDIQDKKDPVQALQEGEIRAIIRAEENMEAKLQRLEPVQISIVYDSTNQKSTTAQSILTGLLKEWEQSLVIERLQSEDIPQELIRPLQVETESVASNRQQAGSLFSFVIPLILIMSCVTGGLAAATDIMAGEKEKGTLEALLTTPANAMSVLFAKLSTVAVMGCLSAVASTVSMLAAFRYMLVSLLEGAEGDLTFTMAFLGPGSIFWMLLILILLAMLFAAAMVTISSFAKTYKEAQTYLAPMTIVAMVPAYLTMPLSPNEISVSYLFVPVLNAAIIFKEILYGMLDSVHLGIVLGSTLVYVFFFVLISTAAFRRESLIVKG